MVISFQRVFSILPQTLQLESKRAQLLASNIANADTPGYKARDIDFRAALQAAEGMPRQLPLVRTHAQDLEPVSLSPRPVTLYQTPFQPSLDGNTVDLQRNEAEFGQNAARYQATLTFLGSRISGLRKALTGQ